MASPEALRRRVSRPTAGRRETWLVLGLLLLTVLVPLQGKAADDDPATGLSQFVWAGAYLAAATRLFSMKRETSALLKKSKLLFAFVGLCFASALWSVAPDQTLKNSVELAGTTAIGIYIVARFELAEFIGILLVFFAVSAVISAGLIFGAPGHGRMDWGGGPWDGIYQDKNSLGASMATAIVVYLFYLLRRGAKHKLFAALALPLFVALLIGANSVTSLLDCIGVVMIGIVLLACLSRGGGVPARVLTVAGGACVAIGIALFGFNTSAIFEMLGRSQSLTGRADFWPYLSKAIAARPVLGYGYGAFFRSPVSDEFLDSYVEQAGGWRPYHAHNSFLQTTIDTGYAGLSVLILLLAAAAWRALIFLLRERTALSIWPLLMILYLAGGSYSETYLGNYNTLEWILFVAAFLYPVRQDFTDRS